jgi:hypothetical protein
MPAHPDGLCSVPFACGLLINEVAGGWWLEAVSETVTET